MVSFGDRLDQIWPDPLGQQVLESDIAFPQLVSGVGVELAVSTPADEVTSRLDPSAMTDETRRLGAHPTRRPARDDEG